TGEIEADITLVGSLAVEVVEKSIINAVKKADSVENIMAYKDIVKKREI
ncbi:L-aminopeptidase/D-esterase domain protein, partial [Clostridioides difficile 655]